MDSKIKPAMDSKISMSTQVAKDPNSLLAKLVEERDSAEYLEEDEHTRSSSATRIQSHWRGYKTRKRWGVRRRAAKK